MAKNLIHHPTRTELADMGDTDLVAYAEQLAEQYGNPDTKNGPAARLIREMIHRITFGWPGKGYQSDD